MRRAVVLLFLAACSGSASPDGVSASEEELRARAPIPYVLQYVGGYEGHGEVESLFLKRNGTFSAIVRGARETGVFVGPRHPKEPLVVSLVTHGDSMRVTLRADWQATRYEADVDHDGAKTTLDATFPAGGESMCDDSGGSWTDDDPDPATGLYCVCEAPESFIPSLGGCTR
jgi:hypothetical protein